MVNCLYCNKELINNGQDWGYFEVFRCLNEACEKHYEVFHTRQGYQLPIEKHSDKIYEGYPPDPYLTFVDISSW